MMSLRELGISQVTVKNPNEDEALRIFNAQRCQRTAIVCTHSRRINDHEIFLSRVVAIPALSEEQGDNDKLHELYDAMRGRGDATVTVTVSLAPGS